MNVQVLVTGGAGRHDAASIGDGLCRVATGAGLTTTVLTGPDAVRRAAEEAGPGDVVTVHALYLQATAPAAAHLADPATRPDPDDLDVVEGWVRGGGGLVALHTAVICFDADPRWRGLCGAAWSWGTSSHPPPGPVRVDRTGPEHPVTVEVGAFEVVDEVYLDLDLCDDVTPLLTTELDGSVVPLVWARGVGEGRVVTDLLGHDLASITDPSHGRLLGQALRWAAGGAEQ